MSIFSAQIATKTMVPVCRDLATYYDAGIPVTRALDSIARNIRHPRVRRVFRDMNDDIREGATLQDAVQKQRKYLSPFFIHLLASGEQGGRLDEMLRDLADYYEDRLAMQRKLIGMLIYPMFLVCAAWFILTFAWRVINVALAGINSPNAAGVGGVMRAAREWAAFQVKTLIIIGVIVGICAILSRLGVFQWISSAVTTHLWPISGVTRKFGLARFFRSFALLLSSGLGVIPCIRNAAAVTGNPYMEREFLKAIPVVKEGSTLSEAFAPIRYLTPTAREMLAVGEESGNLDGHLKKLAQYLMDEAAQAARNMVTAFATTLMIVIVFSIGAFVIMFWVRYYSGMMDELGI